MLSLEEHEELDQVVEILLACVAAVAVLYGDVTLPYLRLPHALRANISMFSSSTSRLLKRVSIHWSCFSRDNQLRRWRSSGSGTSTSHGTVTPLPLETSGKQPKLPFYLDTGYALFAKRPSQPFPPSFLSPPPGSLPDPSGTPHQARHRHIYVNGEMIRGITNGDDAVLAGENFIGANDGIGAWATRPRGHAAYLFLLELAFCADPRSRLWSRLILHFWALAAEQDAQVSGSGAEPNPMQYLQRAYEQTLEATMKPSEWHGTTTACAALLHCARSNAGVDPVLYITNLGDSQILVLRPNDQEVIYKTAEQWHWFDCPRQLGTNSLDTPLKDAVMGKIVLEENDVVLAMSDGVTDNLWEHEIVHNVVESLRTWGQGSDDDSLDGQIAETSNGMEFVAEELVKAARLVAEDQFAESPFMERAVEEGLAIEGGIAL